MKCIRLTWWNAWDEEEDDCFCEEFETWVSDPQKIKEFVEWQILRDYFFYTGEDIEDGEPKKQYLEKCGYACEVISTEEYNRYIEKEYNPN